MRKRGDDQSTTARPAAALLAPTALLTLLTLLALCTAACGPSAAPDAPPSSSGPSGDSSRPAPRTGFSVRYEPPSAHDRPDAAFLRGRRLLERASADLDALVPGQRLGRAVEVVARSCDGEGSAYDPEARRIEICYDDVAQERALFVAAGVRPADDEAAAVLTETVFHEAGHAFADVLGLDLGDRAEEDAADRFAALMLIRRGPAGERELRTAARGYELSAAAGDADPDPGEEARGEEARDEHSSDLLRATHHLCLLHGAAPARTADLVGTELLPRERAGRCGEEWRRVRETWQKRLASVAGPSDRKAAGSSDRSDRSDSRPEKPRARTERRPSRRGPAGVTAGEATEATEATEARTFWRVPDQSQRQVRNSVASVA
ncbi:DUF4344 domain-containing metallopeptidase [Streptomyces sp. NPDC051597]|uniref:DUF4344 domain-containing metallopeptidase n=1 Tax=Streptomyces sp. NPDC051597 TaxID=3155049 RepID=UPI00341E17A7